jgi:hypothetical protein
MILALAGGISALMSKPPSLLSEAPTPPPFVICAGLETLPAIIRQREARQPPLHRILQWQHPYRNTRAA